MSNQTDNRIMMQEACDIIGCAPSTLWKMKKEEVFTIDYPNGIPGRGKRCWYYRDEVELYKESRDKDVVRAFRKKRGRIKKSQAVTPSA